MIISASRRTDIPAFYSKWLINRLRAGYVVSVNPFNRGQVSQISLKAEDVEVLVFWTKNPAPLLPYLPELDRMGYRYYFQFTLNGYPRLLEPGLPDVGDLIRTFRQLAEQIGPERVIWRYDPILFTERTDFRYHRKRFAELLKMLSPNTRRVVISIADDYKDSLQRLSLLEHQGFARLEQPQSTPEFGDFFIELAELANNAGLEIYSCAEIYNLQPFNIRPGKCIDDEYIHRVFGIKVTASKDRSQRLECGCVTSKDIGAYNSCIHDCIYCYATHNRKTAHQNYSSYQANSPSLGLAPSVAGEI
ncbi:MAG TPA: DUF1848 domain-containing protein [Bacillota bacterium]